MGGSGIGSMVFYNIRSAVGDKMDGVNDREAGTHWSHTRKRLSEIVDQLVEERRIDMNSVTVTEWHQLIRDAEKILMVEGRLF